MAIYENVDGVIKTLAESGGQTLVGSIQLNKSNNTTITFESTIKSAILFQYGKSRMAGVDYVINVALFDSAGNKVLCKETDNSSYIPSGIGDSSISGNTLTVGTTTGAVSTSTAYNDTKVYYMVFL